MTHAHLALTVAAVALIASPPVGAQAPRPGPAAGPRCLELEIVPTIMAGEKGGLQPDSPARRVDPNRADSPFAGVGSLLLHFPDGYYLCSGTAITPRHVLTAAHCLSDPFGRPAIAPGDATFILNVGGNVTYQTPGAAIDINPGYGSVGSFFARFDLAILTLATDLPAEVPTYDILRSPLPLRSIVTMVGYGVTGYGDSGIDAKQPLTLYTKRTGRNAVDFIGRPGRSNENVFYYDFDSPSASGLNVLGGPSLGNRVETSAAFGDSGGPNFVHAADGSWRVAGVTSFGTHYRAAGAPRFATFGEGGGGVLVSPYSAWIDGVTGAAPATALPVFESDASDASTALVADVDENAFDYYVIAWPAATPSPLRLPAPKGDRQETHRP